MKAWAVWLTGLPGSGKTVRAKELLKKLKQINIKVEYLRMDEIRKVLTPKQEYTEKERDYAYRAFVLIGKFLTENGINVIMDATGHRKVWRELARELIPNFAEVYLKCPLNICIEREANRKNNLVVSNLYKKAYERLKTGKKIKLVGDVIGIDVPFEEPDSPDMIIDSDKIDPKESSEKIFQFLNLKFIKQ
ncbi:MAG: adenylyl-sulfate kinase [Candidatus Aenigmarchaeota archaeon]|nr:adenylyl-sulfate kinase [Candidatus Aenigmarchaeota archaeon]